MLFYLEIHTKIQLVNNLNIEENQYIWSIIAVEIIKIITIIIKNTKKNLTTKH